MNQKKYDNIRNAIDGYLSIGDRMDKLIDRQNALSERCPIIDAELNKLENETSLQIQHMSKLTSDTIINCIGLINLYGENRKSACGHIKAFC